ncbi:MAG: ATP-binding protein [Bacteroidales bacterium]
MSNLKIPETLIKRDTYISRILPFMNKSIVKVITGSRRVGKSYLLFQLMQTIIEKDKNANIIYLNMEELVFEEIKNAIDLNNYVNQHIAENQMNYIFVDEIQEIFEFEKAIRSLQLDPKNDIYITGSNANLLSGELATLLGGRTIEFSVYSLSYSEFLEFHKLTENQESVLKFIKYGGLPYLIHLELADEIAFEYLKNIYASIVYKDVVSRYKIRSTNFLERLIRFLASNVSSMYSSKSISNFLKSQNINIAHNQVQTFTDYLVSSFLIHKVPRYDLIGKRMFEVGEKYYFENTGIRNAIIEYNQNDLSKLIENVVYNHLLFTGHDVKIGWMNGLEIDFVAKKQNEITYIQVALSIINENTIEREFGNLLKINDNYPKLVITMEEPLKNTFKGIQHISLRKFLMTFV